MRAVGVLFGASCVCITSCTDPFHLFHGGVCARSARSRCPGTPPHIHIHPFRPPVWGAVPPQRPPLASWVCVWHLTNSPQNLLMASHVSPSPMSCRPISLPLSAPTPLAGARRRAASSLHTPSPAPAGRRGRNRSICGRSPEANLMGEQRSKIFHVATLRHVARTFLAQRPPPTCPCPGMGP